MTACLVTAPTSGTGKTAVTCGLLALLKRKGYRPCAFKCGPDYIDPMFHRSVLGVESHNLDLFLADESTVRKIYHNGCSGHDAAVCEGAMGFYDGVAGTTTQASAWHVADTLGLPVIVVIRPKGASLTLAAQLRGLNEFRKPSHIAGIILNDCSKMLFHSLAPMLERETGIPVLGFLPHMEQAEFESRHLGLYTAGEISDLSERIDAIAETMEETLDFERLKTLCECENSAVAETKRAKARGIRLAVARDEAFCFAYAETLEALESAGAEIVPFSPITDDKLPKNVHGLYLSGGYPELHTRELSENLSMRESIRRAVQGGMPTVAECGGFLYLGRQLLDSTGTAYPMVGVLNGTAEKKERLVRFGYASITAKGDSLLFRAGESVPIHEFHYWDSTENGEALTAVKPVSGRSWQCGFMSESMYAGFPHLYFAGYDKMTERWVKAMERWRDGNEAD